MTEVMDNQKQRLSVVFVGHVDHGKSSIIGRLLADTNSLPKGKLEAIEEFSLTNGNPFEYAFLIDALKDERSQNITIDSARVFFQSDQRDYIIIDAPGHSEFIKNMVTGSSRSEAAVLVIDAEEGVQENSKRHAHLLHILGITQIAVVVNKMDRVNYAQDIFRKVVHECDELFELLGFKPMCYIPASAKKGDNIVNHSQSMPWYSGHTVLSALDSFPKEELNSNKPFRLAVQDVYKFTQDGDSRRIIAGQVISGSLAVGDRLTFFPSLKHGTVKTIESFPPDSGTSLDIKHHGGFTIHEQIFVQRGEIAVIDGDKTPTLSKKILTSLFWLGRDPLVLNKTYYLKSGSAKIKMEIESIRKVIDSSNYITSDNHSQVNHHEMAICEIKLHKPLAFERIDFLPQLNRFVVVDDYQISGGGIILNRIDETVLPDEIQNSVNDTAVTSAIRSQRYGQKPTLILISGPFGSGRKKFAHALENELFRQGKFVYYPGIGSLLDGISTDLQPPQTPSERNKYFQKAANLVYSFLDAGMIIIITAIDLTNDDLTEFRQIIQNINIICIQTSMADTGILNADFHIPSSQSYADFIDTVITKMHTNGTFFNPAPR